VTYEEWEKVDKAMEHFFPRTYHLPAETKVLWFSRLQRFTYAEAMDAVGRLAETVDAFPSLAQLVTAMQGSVEDQALLAFEEVCEKASLLVYPKYVGSPSGPRQVPLEWEDPYALKALEAMGGARQFLETAADTIGVTRKHFTNAYEAVVNDAKRAGKYVAPPPKAVRDELAEQRRALIKAANTPPALPAPHEVVPMPEDFPAEWRKFIGQTPKARPIDHKPQGARQLAERAKPPEKVVRLADVVKEDSSDDE
jgi:hypothetical protein